MTVAPDRTSPRQRLDGVSLLTFYLVLLLAIPSRLSFAPLGGAGSPAVVVGLMGLATWAYFHVMRVRPWGQGKQPVRDAAFILLFCFLISFVYAMKRPIEPDESSTAQLSLICVLSWVGVLALTSDGIPTRERFDTLIQRVVHAGAALAALGLIQFVTGKAWVDMISIPGLTPNQALGALASRDGLNRPSGTAIHPIEYGAILTMTLPIAINLALADKTRGMLARWLPPALLGAATIVSISRSAILCAFVGVILLTPVWTRGIRIAALFVGAGFLGLATVVSPKVVTTIFGLFLGMSNDSSAASRVDSYPLAGEFISRSPWFGRGFGTFLPKYRIFDNEYLLLSVEVGLIGVAAMLLLIVTAMISSRMVVGTTSDPALRLSGQALFAATATGGVGLAFYDGLGFPMAAGYLFFLLGLAGAQWRLARRAPGFDIIG